MTQAIRLFSLQWAVRGRPGLSSYGGSESNLFSGSGGNGRGLMRVKASSVRPWSSLSGMTRAPKRGGSRNRSSEAGDSL